VCGISGRFSSSGGSFRRTRLTHSEVSIVTGYKNQGDRARRLHSSRPVLWFFFAVLNLTAVTLIVVAGVIFLCFDWWRRGWGWGIFRCILVPLCVFMSFHLIWYALSLIAHNGDMKHEYHEGPEAKERFEKLATRIFLVRLNLP
jgi:hypothetical protein